jgi:ribosome biogenesis protein Nip4
MEPLQKKTHELNRTIREKLAELDLKLVDGPDPRRVSGPEASFGSVNLQERAVYCFAVAEA